jgi:hypothetical protein
MSHTPGPWHFMPAAHMADCNEEGPVAGVFDDDDGPDALIGTAERDEDARLIAAAPDLYDALLSLRAASSPAARRLARRWADEALAKATGEPS